MAEESAAKLAALKEWIIKHDMKKLWWSYETGWGSKAGATRHTKQARFSTRLPINGKWTMVNKRKES